MHLRRRIANAWGQIALEDLSDLRLGFRKRSEKSVAGSLASSPFFPAFIRCRVLMTLQKPPLSVAERRREREMQHELLKFHRDSIEPVATMITKKRLRVPRVEMETNPFCMERQLADGYAQLNFNKLTQLLTPGKATQSSALTSRSGSNSSCYKKSGLSTSSSSLSQREAFDVDVKVDEELKRQNPGKARKARELELEREFKNPVYYPPRERKVGQFPPPTDQTTAQLIDKYRKLAVGKLPDMS
ncbi:hypothetical protein BBJ28_00000795 [Nothophytophthora sp. Chile5]|nr:hypothetical protein BBJ28_00000795 [Nothophytophthora sp. Chile5]